MSIDRRTQQIKNVKSWPKKAGRANYLRYLHGEKLTRAESMEAYCYVCVCGGDTAPCIVPECPLTPFCQWNKPKKATESKANKNSPDALHSVPQSTPDQAMKRED